MTKPRPVDQRWRLSRSRLKKMSVMIGAALLVQASMAVALAVPPAHRGVGVNPGQGQSRSVEARSKTDAAMDRGGAWGRAKTKVPKIEKAKAPKIQGHANGDAANKGKRARGGSRGSGRGIINAGRNGAPVGAVEGFICPVDPTLATFSNDWGAPRSGNRYHQGTDVFAPYGTPLVAVVDGVVTLSGSRLGGVVVYLTAENNTRYYYAHLSGYSPGLRSGDEVLTGDLIGFVGDSGNARGTSPHLHFQIHPYGGNPVNPFPTLVEACAVDPG